MHEELAKKHDRLTSILRDLGGVAVALSGGVDSTLLARVAHDVLGDRMIAVTMRSAFVPARDLEEARAFTRAAGIAHVVVDADVLAVPGVADNPPDRCYHCKRAVFARVAEAAAAHGISAVADGSNVDDLADYRPGHRALRELGVHSPLLEAGMTKADVRALSRELGLATWDKPSAACLASRIPYGDRITQDKLDRVDAAEAALRELGLRNLRVRMHGDLARIEVPADDVARLAQPGTRERVVADIRAAGFTYVTLDLQGYRTGSLNEELARKNGDVETAGGAGSAADAETAEGAGAGQAAAAR